MTVNVPPGTFGAVDLANDGVMILNANWILSFQRRQAGLYWSSM